MDTALKAKKKKRAYDALRAREAWTGFVFIVPWLLGFIFLFGRPLVTTIFYAFNTVNITTEGVLTSFSGIDNFYFPFKNDVYFYSKYFLPDIMNFAYEVPIIIIFSLFAAVVLNQRFVGRTLSRAIFFLPVIIMSGVVVSMLKGNGFTYDTDMVSSENAYIFNSGGVITILREAGFPMGMVRWFAGVANRIYDIVWKSGIQIVLYLSGLQSIPRSEYEAAEIEGATAWECFWKITFPRISPMTLVVVVYSIIDSFGGAMGQVKSMFERHHMGIGAALATTYSGIVIVVLIVVTGIISRFVFYTNE
jgi:ABC-type sugar transport system permease subunit